MWLASASSIWEVVSKEPVTERYPSLLNPCESHVNEQRAASFLRPPADASCSCALLPACTQTLLSEDVTTAKSGHGLNLNGEGAALNGAALAEPGGVSSLSPSSHAGRNLPEEACK